MKHIYIKPTEQCNLRCKHCYIGENRNNTVYFDVDKTIEYLKQYKEQEVLVHFHGGEPFLAKLEDLIKICETFPNWNYAITSNLVLPMTSKHLNLIKKYCIEENKPFIKTSWDYNIRFNNEKELELWKKNVKYFANNGVRVVVLVCLYDDFVLNCTPSDFCSLMRTLPITDIVFERISNNEVPMTTSIIENWLCELLPLTKEIPISFEFFDNLRYAKKGMYIGCRSATCMKDVITINPNGTIGSCPNIADKIIIGNIDGEFNINNYNLCLMQEKFNVRCLMCEYFKICHGGGCSQQKWQGDTCPGMKKLLKLIMEE